MISRLTALSKEDAFNCPICNAYAHQEVASISFSKNDGSRSHALNASNFAATLCQRCKKLSLWHQQDLIFPGRSTAPSPSADMPEDCKSIFNEARSVLNASSRSASALLRLCLQLLLKHLGENGKNINNDIGSLVAKGLPATLQQAMDSIRIIGNNAAHPGQIDLEEDPSLTLKLFQIINFIVHNQITAPKQIEGLYEGLPESARIAVDKRDKA